MDGYMIMKDFLACLLCCVVGITYGDSFSQQLMLAMKAYQVPVVGYAIIDHNRIVRAETLSIGNYYLKLKPFKWTKRMKESHLDLIHFNAKCIKSRFDPLPFRAHITLTKADIPLTTLFQLLHGQSCDNKKYTGNHQVLHLNSATIRDKVH